MRTYVRYTNRRIYDKVTQKHVTLHDIIQAVLEGIEVEVIQHETDLDITADILAKAYIKMPLSTNLLISLIKSAGSV